MTTDAFTKATTTLERLREEQRAAVQRPVIDAQARLAPALGQIRGIQREYDGVVTTLKPDFGRWRAFLGDAVLDSLENIATPLRWARHDLEIALAAFTAVPALLARASKRSEGLKPEDLAPPGRATVAEIAEDITRAADGIAAIRYAHGRVKANVAEILERLTRLHEATGAEVRDA